MKASRETRGALLRAVRAGLSPLVIDYSHFRRLEDERETAAQAGQCFAGGNDAHQPNDAPGAPAAEPVTTDPKAP